MDELGRERHVMNSKSLGVIQKKACFSRAKGGTRDGGGLGISIVSTRQIFFFLI